jgi:predicted RNA-binding Zn-ribbon protein involved in translation (DUF1610 family)
LDKEIILKEKRIMEEYENINNVKLRYGINLPSSTSLHFNKNKVGWECPKCGAVMSPQMNYCINCKGEKNYDRR